ncbi:MAG: rRNA maturation RNase YbeY [Planctomycetes bacterium]|nr:rRNA maturation RNase YbeY [Planctomycetota bacterium]
MSHWPEVAVEEGLDLPDEIDRDAREFVERVLEAVFAQEKRRLALSVYLCGDAEIRRLHAEYLGDDTVTDVISFRLQDDDASDETARGGFEFADGELVVDVEHAARQANDHGNAWEAECALYVVHGALHLFGYDDHEAHELVRMKTAERAVLARLAYEISGRFDITT